MSRLATVEELSKFLKMGKHTIYRKCKQNKLPHINFAGPIRFDPNQYPGLSEFLIEMDKKKAPSNRQG